MPYAVDFIGLACFSRQHGPGRLVLLPDGRDPGEGIDPHVPRLVVATAAIESMDQLPTSMRSGATLITLPQCRVHFPGADVEEAAQTTLDTTRHDPVVPRLSAVDPRFDLDGPGAVVSVQIRKGTLRAFRHPGSGERDPAIVSRLEVPHEGPIEISIDLLETGRQALVRLSPGTEIVLANSAPRPNPLNVRSHFHIYAKLSNHSVNLSNRQPVAAAGLERLRSPNPFFSLAGGIGSGGDCTNTGCC